MDINTITSLLVTYAIPALIALAVFWIGSKIARALGNKTTALLGRKPDMDKSLAKFLGSLVRYLLLVVTLIAALEIIGVNTSSFSAIILGLGAAMAFVLQGSLSNIAAGVMLVLFRPFSIGDTVEIAGKTGKVKDISLTATTLTTVDNVEVIVANGKAWGGTIKNRTVLGTRRYDKVFQIDSKANIDKAFKVITSEATKNARVLKDPEPWAKVVKIGDSSTDIELRVWCKSEDYRPLGGELIAPIFKALRAADISIPYPHEVKIRRHVKNSKGRARLARSRAKQST